MNEIKRMQELAGLITESQLNEEDASKTILGVKFNMIPAQSGIKFQFKDPKQFMETGMTVNSLVDEITKMLNSKYGEGTFTFIPSGRLQTDSIVNGLEFKMNPSNFFKGL